jgi:hypothetical protein
MSLEDNIKKLQQTPQRAQVVGQRASYPSGWEPGIRHEGNGGMLITTDLGPSLDDEDSWKAAVESLGVTVPLGWTVRPVEARYDPAAWHRDEEGGGAVTRPIWRYRFKIEPSAASIPYDDLVDVIAKHKPRKSKDANESLLLGSTWVLATGDWQLGKMDGDGTDGTVKRILDTTDQAIDRINELRRLKRWPGRAMLALTGDCVEGFNSQNGSNIWRTTLSMTDQVRLYRRIVMHMVTTIAKECDELLVVAVPGNHGETVRVAGKMATRIDDSWDLDAVVAVADALEQNVDAYGHVSFAIPEVDSGTLVLDVSGTVTALAHGHQVPRGNVPAWVAEHAKNMAPVGDAHLVITGHHHHLKIESMGPRTWVQVPSMESESTWWKERTGSVSPPGMVSMLVGGKAWSDLAVL